MIRELPDFLRHEDREYVSDLERLRRRYAWGFDQRPLLLNTNHGPMLLDMETAIAWAERLAESVLA